jgi:hypothetical protein
VDQDNTAYFIYTAISQDHAIHVEKLSEDFLGSSGKVSAVMGRNCEAPALFRRGAAYYALFDQTCCFCREGSGARVWTASNPLGPCREIGNINRDATGKPIIPAQQTYVATLETPDGLYTWPQKKDPATLRRDAYNKAPLNELGEPLN